MSGVEFLVFGASGYFGSELVRYLEKGGHSFAVTKARIESRDQIEAAIAQHQPKYVLNAAGLAGTPNIDWFETNQQEGIRINVVGALNVVDICFQKGLHCTTFGTGFVYTYDEAHPLGSGIGFKEEEPSNYNKPYYVKLRNILEELLKPYPNVLNLRVVLPVSDDNHPKCLLSKLLKFTKVIDVPNSITVIDDLWPLIPELARKGVIGNLNFANPGAIGNSAILEAYKKHVDPTKTWEVAPAEEAAQLQKAGRPNHELDVSKLLSFFPNVPTAQQSIDALMQRLKVNSGL